MHENVRTSTQTLRKYSGGLIDSVGRGKYKLNPNGQEQVSGGKRDSARRLIRFVTSVAQSGALPPPDWVLPWIEAMNEALIRYSETNTVCAPHKSKYKIPLPSAAAAVAAVATAHKISSASTHPPLSLTASAVTATATTPPPAPLKPALPVPAMPVHRTIQSQNRHVLAPCPGNTSTKDEDSLGGFKIPLHEQSAAFMRRCLKIVNQPSTQELNLLLGAALQLSPFADDPVPPHERVRVPNYVFSECDRLVADNHLPADTRRVLKRLLKRKDLEFIESTGCLVLDVDSNRVTTEMLHAIVHAKAHEPSRFVHIDLGNTQDSQAPTSRQVVRHHPFFCEFMRGGAGHGCCVRPSHLAWGSHAANAAERVARTRRSETLVELLAFQGMQAAHELFKQQLQWELKRNAERRQEAKAAEQVDAKAMRISAIENKPSPSAALSPALLVDKLESASSSLHRSQEQQHSEPEKQFRDTTFIAHSPPVAVNQSTISTEDDTSPPSSPDSPEIQSLAKLFSITSLLTPER